MASFVRAFVGQVLSLVHKNILLAVVRRPIGFLLCIYGLPLALLAILLSIPTFVSSSDRYGVSSPKPLSELSDILNKKLVIVRPPNLGPDVDRVTEALTRDLDEALVHFVESENELTSLCLANLRGVSDCFASVTFRDSPETTGSYYSEAFDQTNYEYADDGDEGEAIPYKTRHVWEYVLRTDPAKSLGSFNVFEHKTAMERLIMPVQLAINNAITNSSVLPEIIGWTAETQEEQDTYAREDQLFFVGRLYGFLLVTCYFFIIYRHTSFITAEREAGMSQLVDAMGGSGAGIARTLSWLIVFNVSCLPVFVAFGALYARTVFPTASTALVIGWQVLLGLAINSSTVFAASFFTKARVSSIYVMGAFFLLTVAAQVYSFESKPKPQPPGAYILTLLFPSSNFLLFMQQLCLWEFNREEANISILPPPENGINSTSYGVTQATMLGFLVFQIILYPVLAVLVEKFVHGIDFRNRTFGKQDGASSAASGGVIAETFDLKKHFKPGFLARIFCRGKRKSVKAVDGVSIQSHKGQILGLVGPNGSGKTTTLHMMSGILSPDSGTTAFQGTLAQIGICPQRNTFWEDLTVFEHVRIWSRIKSANMTPLELDRLLIACDLELKRNSKAKTLSGGQKRKLQLACMFVGDSSVCLIDECTSGLDPLSRRAIWDILMAQRAKRSIIFTTHFLDEVDVLADHIVVLTNGKVKSQGPTAELKNLYGGGYKVLAPTSTAKSMAVPYPGVEHQDHIAYTTPDSASAAALCAQLSAAGITDISITGPQVEDVFRRVADDTVTTDQQDTIPATHDDFEMSPAETTSFWHQVKTLLRKRLVILKRFWWPYLYVLLLPFVITPHIISLLDEYQRPTCEVPDALLYDGGPNQFYYDAEYCTADDPCDSIRIGPDSAGDVLRDLIRRNFWEVNSVSPANFSSFADISNNVEDFIERATVQHYRNPGGVYLGSADQAPIITFQANWGGDGGFMMMNMLAQMESGVQILATTGSFGTEAKDGGTQSGNFYVIVSTLLQALYPAAFVLYPALERDRKVRSLQYSNGVRRGPLWVAYGLFDGMFVFAVSLGTTAILHSQAAGYWNGPLWIMFPILFLYGIAGMLLGYVVSHYVRGPLKSFLATAGVSLLMFAAAAVSFSVGSGYAEAAQMDSINLGLTFGLNLLLPIGNVFRAFLLGLNVLQVGCKDGGFLPTESIYAFGGPILYLVLQVAMLLALIIWIEGDMALFHRKSQNGSVSMVDGEKAMGMRSDEVKSEAARVEESETDLLRALCVDKSFGSNHAVDNVSFGLAQSDVLALIGPNGAGKSTLVNLIQSELSCDSGNIYLKGEDARTRSAQKYLGVCPQHDAPDLMTAREHLTFYARIKGIKDIDGNVNHVMDRLGLTPHASTLANKLSGGNKRKLSLAIALMGKPPVLILDEPTSAMDAIAKRSFWKIIQEITPGRSVLLTTHSMEEADTLATRTAILSRKLLAVGTTQALRHKYNNVYYVEIQLASAPNSSADEMEALRDWVHTKIPNSKLEREILGGQVRFTVPGTDERGQNPIAGMIELLEREKDEQGIAYYSIGGATLERVFLNVVRENNVSEEDGKLGRGERLRRFLRLKR